MEASGIVSHGRQAWRLVAAVLTGLAFAATACAGHADTQQKSPPAKPAPGVQTTAPGKPSGGSGNSGKPIEIVSDRLTVDQNSQIATFLGNVEAVQGTMSLRADTLRVFYTQNDRDQASQGQGGQQPAGGGDQSIRRVEAEGNVLVTTPTETAQGDSGVYDPATRKVVLLGNVVLTRGQNVVRGTRLDSDLATGISVVTGAPAATAAAGKHDQRVRALFVPEQNPPDQPNQKGR